MLVSCCLVMMPKFPTIHKPTCLRQGMLKDMLKSTPKLTRTPNCYRVGICLSIGHYGNQHYDFPFTNEDLLLLSMVYLIMYVLVSDIHLMGDGQ